MATELLILQLPLLGGWDIVQHSSVRDNSIILSYHGRVPLCHCQYTKSEPLQTFGFLKSTFCHLVCHLMSTSRELKQHQHSRDVHTQCLVQLWIFRFQYFHLGSGFSADKLTVHAHGAHLLPALFTIRRGKQSSVLMFLGRLLEVFRDRRKKPTKPKQKFIHASPQTRYFRRPAPFLEFFISSPDTHQRPKSQWVVLENTCMNTWCPGGAFCWMSTFPSFLSRAVSGKSGSRSAGPCPGESPIQFPPWQTGQGGFTACSQVVRHHSKEA